MSAGVDTVLAVCGGGGSDAVGFIAVLVLGALYALAVLAAIGRAEDAEELAALIILLLVSVAIGGLFFLYPHGVSGNGDYLARFVISLVVAGVIGAGVVAKLGEQSAGRVFFIALAGDVLIPGGLFVLLFASVGLGTGCLD
jgi:peptidoglycan/LPS O-acetylase OafA/YrhL